MEFLLLLLVARSTSSQVQRLSEKSEMSIIVLKKKKKKASSKGYIGKHGKRDRITRSLSVVTPYCRDNQFSGQFISSIQLFNQSSEGIYFGGEKNLTK